MRKTLALLLCFSLFLPILCFPAQAEENKLVISTAEAFLTFAENCRSDSYSKGLSVQLTADIALDGTVFQGVPIFYGSFDGGGHTVSVSITEKGSHIGFFRYLTEEASVQDLHVNATIVPGGTAGNIGGIAGINAGTITGCQFSGEIAGADGVGGIAGNNTLSGTIENCSVQGTVYGNHFVGGIAGTNSGVIRGCSNQSLVNTTEKQNQVDISNITIDVLTGAESAMTVTDIGGIAGTNSGVIRKCENAADIGYPHIGYNIGGIAGSGAGFLTECTNSGAVHGRKDVGGITGHLEPNTALVFEKDTLQILSGQLDTLANLTEKAGANAGAASDTLRTQLELLDSQVEDAKNAADKLRPQEGTVPDPDSILAAGNQLGNSLTGIDTTLGSISTQTENSAQTLLGNIDAIAKQMDAIEKTLENGSENIHSEITDISDLDAEEDTTGKISLCTNWGAVQGDWNTGGIAGIIGFENDLDPESDLDTFGKLSLNNACDIRGVIRSCSNAATVTGKKQNTGGIVGAMALGLVRDCNVTGEISASEGAYTGGVVGRGISGFIRCCYVKSAVSGAHHTGGIAGTASVVTDCYSMVKLTGQEASGAILGYAEDRTQILGNRYLPVGIDLGGIDGINYENSAAPLRLENFLALEGLPELFKSNTVTFRFPDGTEQVLQVPQGSNPDAGAIPQIPSRDGAKGTWVGLHGAVLDNIVFDSVFTVSYDALPNTLASDATRENGQPVLLAQGVFSIGSALSARQITTDERMEACLEAWEFTLPDGAVQLRYHLPENYDPDRVLLRLQDGDYGWRDVDFTVDGSYLIASVQPGDRALQLVTAPTDYTLWIAAAVAILLAAGIATGVVLIRRKKRK